jgi:hypothetical protein
LLREFEVFGLFIKGFIKGSFEINIITQPAAQLVQADGKFGEEGMLEVERGRERGGKRPRLMPSPLIPHKNTHRRAFRGHGMAKRTLAVAFSLALLCHADAFGRIALDSSSARRERVPLHRHASCGVGPRTAATILRSLVGKAPVSRTRLQPLRAKDEGEQAAAGSRTRENADLWQRMANLPILGVFVRFASWIASLFHSVLLVRMTVLLQAMTQLKSALLDPRRRLSAPGSPLADPSVSPGDKSRLAAAISSKSAERSTGSDAQASPTSESGSAKVGGVMRMRADWEPVTSSEVAFQAFWRQMDQLGTSTSVEGEFAALQAESARQRAIQEAALAEVSGVQLSVLDFVEHGGLPPSVEALTAWLEIRDIDTSQWGVGEAKTVQEFFHELWAGESEQLGSACQRVISVVKVRILDSNEEGTWQLYETKQTLCRDGRTRPRNRYALMTHIHTHTHTHRCCGLTVGVYLCSQCVLWYDCGCIFMPCPCVYGAGRPLAEKLRPGERVEDCCVRGVREELGEA